MSIINTPTVILFLELKTDFDPLYNGSHNQRGINMQKSLIWTSLIFMSLSAFGNQQQQQQQQQCGSCGGYQASPGERYREQRRLDSLRQQMRFWSREKRASYNLCLRDGLPEDWCLEVSEAYSYCRQFHSSRECFI